MNGHQGTAETIGQKRSRSGDQRFQRYVKSSQEEKDVCEDWYHVQDGFRYVIPYVFAFRVNCKRRWIGRSILDTFSREFHYKPERYWSKEISSGRLLCRDEKVEPGYILDGSEWMIHWIHRHESAVLDREIDKVYEDDSLLVVSKPPSIPVHPCGSYRRNALTYLTSLKLGLSGLRTVHRLDKHTSGLVIFAKTKEVATRLCKQIEERRVTKTYVALVSGHFPMSLKSCEDKLSFDVREQIARVDPHGKDAVTRFEVVAHSTDHDVSLVRCFPKTGRTHQIRAHLKALGYPICNDPVYCENQKSFGNEEVNDSAKLQLPSLHEPTSEAILAEGQTLECSTCPALTAKEKVNDPAIIYLHAEEYAGEGWRYKSKLPYWAASIHEATNGSG
mmetsp:Transcript_19367/g.77396  ORF Transcript_19367/g.77396 Transcript_19367/m.77396 type:complete len:389 (-) Transcript_19367:437-1603(-)